jgi:hypothetical protein
MSKLEIGEYVRINNGIIFKLLSKSKTSYGYCGKTDNEKIPTYVYGKGKSLPYEIKGRIVKHSKNIIDLIELEDFVNGYFVHAINYIEKRVSVMSMNEYGYSENIDLYEKDIKSIVTKEQFKSIEYEV